MKTHGDVTTPTSKSPGVAPGYPEGGGYPGPPPLTELTLPAAPVRSVSASSFAFRLGGGGGDECVDDGIEYIDIDDEMFGQPANGHMNRLIG